MNHKGLRLSENDLQFWINSLFHFQMKHIFSLEMHIFFHMH